MKAIILRLFIKKFSARQKKSFHWFNCSRFTFVRDRSWKQKVWTDLKTIWKKFKGIQEDKRQNAERYIKTAQKNNFPLEKIPSKTLSNSFYFKEFFIL